MYVSTKFPIAVHTIMLIAALSDRQKVNSATISESTGINAAIIRKIFKSLKQAGMILVSPGPGGATLARKAEDITLWDILSAVEVMETEQVFRFHPHPSEHCPIGNNINDLLKNHLDDALKALQNELSSVTMSMLVDELCEFFPALKPEQKLKEA